MRRHLFIFILGLITPALAMAQRHHSVTDASNTYGMASKQMADGHYYAAEQTLLNYLREEGQAQGGFPRTGSPRATAECLLMICKYYLKESGAGDMIVRHLESHPLCNDYDRLNLMRANLLVQSGHDNEAMDIYRTTSMYNVGDDEQSDARLYYAIASIQTGDIATAKVLLNQLRFNERHGMDVLYYTAYIDYTEGRYDEALEKFRTTEKTFDYHRKAPVYIADCLLLTGKSEDALSTILNYKNRYGQTELTPEADRIEGECLHDKGDFFKAIERLTQYTGETETPKRTALYKLAMSYLRTQKYSQAADNFVRSAGTERDELAQSAYLNAGISYLDGGNKTQARMAFQQASEMGGKSAASENALYNYALCLHEGKTGGFGEQVNVMERFLNDYPQSKNASKVGQYLTEVYSTTKDYSAALASINKIKQPTKEILAAKQQVLYNLGAQAYANSDFKAAADYMTQSLQLGAHNPQTKADAFYWRGEAEYRMGDYVQASSDLKQSVTLTNASSSNYGNALYSLGYALFKQKKYSDAATAFRRLSDLNTDNKAVLADAYNRIGDCLLSAKNYDAAQQAYGLARAADKNQGDYSLYQQALIKGVNGNYAGKVDLLSQLRTEYTESQFTDDAVFEQGLALMQSGEKDRAMNVFRSLIDSHPQGKNTARAGVNLGMLYAETVNIPAAISTFTQVIDNFPNTQEAQSALAALRDIYTNEGRIEEYNNIASKAGQPLTSQQQEDMLSVAAARATAAGKYSEAAKLFAQLETFTSSEEKRLEAQQGLLENAYNAKDFAATTDVATRMLQNVKLAPDMRVQALFFRAASQNAMGNMQAAVQDWTTLSQDAQTEFGAQSNVLLADYAYQTAQYESAESILLKFIDSGTPHAYWLARGFILLSDVYRKTGKDVEAKQYLLSLKSNYNENEEINRMIEERLNH
ncbi:MAG: tetratricopeptide repeat protein [Bacteroidaceae bacterium]|nr:tetratricopeptide repeat protein [Bacteroidaceae bacterium]